MSSARRNRPPSHPRRDPSPALPYVDFAPFIAGAASARRAVALEMAAACRDIGFFYLVNHGVSAAARERAFEAAAAFFALPEARKAAIAIERSANHRGWFAVGGENLDPRRQLVGGDLKEGIKIGRDLAPAHPLVRAGLPLHGPNQWPSDVPGFRAAMQEYYDELVVLGRRLMRAFALALDLDECHFDPMLTDPMATLGPLRYPPHEVDVEDARIGAGAHTDFGCLTILAQDEHPGLQVRDRAGAWIDAPPMAGSFVINVGDMLARWTNDLFASTAHRVINASGAPRLSMPFFFDPNFDADLTALPTCVTRERPARYPPTTGGAYLLERIDATFAYHRERR